MNYKITSEFSDIDSAESAARHIKHCFSGVGDTKIFYKDHDADRLYPRRHISTSPDRFTNSTLGGIYFPSYISGYREVSPIAHNAAYEPETDLKNETIVQILTGDYNTAKNISAYLRSAGGLGVKILEA